MIGKSKEAERQNNALKSILKGEKPEKRVFFGYEGDKKLAKKEFEEAQRQIEEKLEATKEARMPWFCPECDKVMKKRLDNRMWYLYGHCFDCQIDVEHKMKIAGVYDEWEEEKIKTNKLAWLQDKKQELIEFKKQKTPTFYNQVRPDGYSVDKETWNMGVENIDKLANEALKHLEKIEESLK
jgi:ribosomal protein L37AE/L43A|tara:strand:- start:1657 stop:2202 length:546 start_codon:yes stop_codon:yes gene_type:complete